MLRPRRVFKTIDIFTICFLCFVGISRRARQILGNMVNCTLNQVAVQLGGRSRFGRGGRYSAVLCANAHIAREVVPIDVARRGRIVYLLVLGRRTTLTLPLLPPPQKN